MHNIKKVRCPHCKKIITVDIDEELKAHKTILYKHPFRKPDELAVPKTITVTCNRCHEKFKVHT